MFAVIFIVQPKKDRFDDYLNLAKLLKPDLEKIDGFIDNERFSSKRTEGRVLSLSTWRDEKAVIRWRTLGVHHEVQDVNTRRTLTPPQVRPIELISCGYSAWQRSQRLHLSRPLMKRRKPYWIKRFDQRGRGQYWGLTHI